MYPIRKGEVTWYLSTNVIDHVYCCSLVRRDLKILEVREPKHFTSRGTYMSRGTTLLRLSIFV